MQYKTNDEREYFEKQMQAPFIITENLIQNENQRKYISQVILRQWSDLQCIFNKYLSQLNQWWILVEMLQLKSIDNNLLLIYNEILHCTEIEESDISDMNGNHRFLFREFTAMIIKLCDILLKRNDEQMNFENILKNICSKINTNKTLFQIENVNKSLNTIFWEQLPMIYSKKIWNNQQSKVL